MADTDFIAVGCAVVTLSDTRDARSDRSGDLIVERLASMGHTLVDRALLPDDAQTLNTQLTEYMDRQDIDIVILTGGTGITKRDISPDVVAALGTKHIPGFGELFRMLSYRDIGSSTIQSRAGAWLCDTTLIFVLPGSTNAVRLAMDEILVEQLDATHRPCNFIRLLPRIR